MILRRAVVAVLALAAASPAAASAAQASPSVEAIYELVLPDGRPVTYELELDVLYPGAIRVEAEWPGTRVIAFRLERPGAPETEVRRSGPSPQTVVADVAEWNAGVGSWRLWIHALPGKGRAAGRMTIGVPGPPPPPPTPGVPATPVASTDDRPPWGRPAAAPAGAPRALAALYERTEAIRTLVIDEDTPDACRWQADFVRWIAARRDGLASGGPRPASATRKLAERMVEMIQAVEALRTSRDPLFAGPGPADPVKRAAWLRTRRTRLAPIAHGLDDVVHRLGGGHAPELEIEAWPSRLMICATAVERHFDQRADVGAALAVNGDVAREQWPRILAAADALDALIAAPAWSPGSAARAGDVAATRAAPPVGDPGLD